MSAYELIWLFALVVTHAVAYYMGKADAESFHPSDKAWVAVQCYAIDKQFERERWLKERADETEETAASSDQ